MSLRAAKKQEWNSFSDIDIRSEGSNVLIAQLFGLGLQYYIINDGIAEITPVYGHSGSAGRPST